MLDFFWKVEDNRSIKKGKPLMKPLITYTFGYLAYVSGDGNYGVDSTVFFDYDTFEARYPEVWSMLDDLSDSNRFDLIVAVLDQDEELLRDFAEEYELPLKALLDTI
jgi:hypothetical protein